MEILFFGDWCHQSSDEGKPIVEHSALNRAITRSDAIIANFEGAIKSAEGHFIKKTGPYLSQSPISPRLISALGVTHCSLANNHTLDYGESGLINTVNALSAQRVATFGFATPDFGDWRTFWIGEPGDGGVALIGGAEREFTVDAKSRASSIDPIELHRAVIKAIGEGYSAIPILHGGLEWDPLPPPHLRRLARWLIECGATAVITHHPYFPGFVEHWEGKPIAWSLGSLWRPGLRDKSKTKRDRGYAIKLSISKNNGAVVDCLMSYAIDYNRNKICKLSGEEAKIAQKKQRKHESICRDQNAYSEWWSETIKKERHAYLSIYSFPFMPRTILHPLLALFCLLCRWLQKKPRWLLIQLNGLRCESHHQMWTYSIEAITKREHHDS
ncbi:CapA family protein [Halorhodospira neutriphila]|uniref:Capsule synthesis protein CapA domain-containing protein n=1 Tax=Halorhodospira neutriphila TaxID=168379 RepID=A0ABS1E527_9GAMM|nr:CapA family protein [Halorhodospira neutriphila]MBK1725924.1 hypothetical protein [Halorhodospira neutriphila]